MAKVRPNTIDCMNGSKKVINAYVAKVSLSQEIKTKMKRSGPWLLVPKVTSWGLAPFFFFSCRDGTISHCLSNMIPQLQIALNTLFGNFQNVAYKVDKTYNLFAWQWFILLQDCSRTVLGHFLQTVSQAKYRPPADLKITQLVRNWKNNPRCISFDCYIDRLTAWLIN